MQASEYALCGCGDRGESRGAADKQCSNETPHHDVVNFLVLCGHYQLLARDDDEDDDSSDDA